MRHAQGFRRLGRMGEPDPPARSFLRRGIAVPQQAGGSFEGAGLGRKRPLPLCRAPRRWAFRMTSRQRRRVAFVCGAFANADRGARLEARDYAFRAGHPDACLSCERRVVNGDFALFHASFCYFDGPMALDRLVCRACGLILVTFQATAFFISTWFAMQSRRWTGRRQI